MKMGKKGPPWWLYLVLSIGSFIAAGLYFGRAFTVGPSTQKIVTGVIFLGLAVFWLISSHLAMRNRRSTDDS